MNTTPSEPVALIVEDKARALRTRKHLFDAHGFRSLGVQTYSEAIVEIRSNPSIDLLVTDINLDATNTRDRSGVTLAREVKKYRPQLPIVGYSGLFAESDLKQSDWKLFDSHLPKGDSTPEQIEKMMEVWRQEVSARHNNRVADALDALTSIRNKYNIKDIDFQVLREFIPLSTGHCDNVSGELEEEGPNEILMRLGYRLHLVEAGSPRPTLANAGGHVRSTIPVWLRKSGIHSVAEICGIPTLYSYGNTDQEAINNLLIVMDGFHRDLQDDKGKTEVAGDVTLLRRYLKRVLD